MSLASSIAKTLFLPSDAAAVLASLYERQPATPHQLAERTGLTYERVRGSLAHLSGRGVLRGGARPLRGRPGYVWLDLAPTLSALEVEA